MINPVFLKENTLDSMWFTLLSEIYKNEKGRVHRIDNGSFAGSSRLEFDFVSGVILHPTTRPLAPIMPEGVPPVTSDDDIMNYFVNYIMDGHNLAKNEHYRYATWITGGKYKMPEASLSIEGKEFFKFDQYNLPDNRYQNNTREFFTYGLSMNVPNQVEWAINHYKQKGFGNNHCYIQIGYPESNRAYDMPYETEADRQTSPCLRGIDTKVIRDNDGKRKLCLHVYFRSWDLYGAWPENMGGMTMLMEYMANELEIETGYLAFSSQKLHCYDFQVSAVKSRLNMI